jgi:hypothetical protein
MLACCRLWKAQRQSWRQPGPTAMTALVEELHWQAFGLFLSRKEDERWCLWSCWMPELIWGAAQAPLTGGGGAQCRFHDHVA